MKLFKRKETGVYYARFGIKRISLKTKDKKEAERLFKALRTKYLAGQLNLDLKGNNITLSQVIKEFLDYQLRINTKRTYEIYRNTLNLFFNFIQDIEIKHITKKNIEMFLAERLKKVRRHTVGIDYRNLKAFFNYCKENNYINDNPVCKIKFKIEKKLPVFLVKEEIRKLFDIIKDEKYKVLFALYIYTGRRRNEILELKLSDIDMINHRLRYYNRKKKLYNTIPIIKPLRELLYDYINRNIDKIKNNPEQKLFNIAGVTVTHRFKEFFKKIGRDDINVHALRHTFASLLTMGNVPIRVIQELLDHSDISTTLIYSHISKDYREEALKVLEDI